jgi:hypothetical protein
VEGTATVTDYQPYLRAAWDVRFGAFDLRQAVDLLPEQNGAATRLRLVVETRAKGPIRVVLPLLRGRFRRTMTRSLAIIDSLIGQANP